MTNCLQKTSSTTEVSETEFTDCWFELDGTLINLDGLDDLLERGWTDDSEEYKAELADVLQREWRQLVYSPMLESIRRRYPSLRINLLSYLSDVCLEVILRTCWPDFEWDLIAAPLAEGLPCAWRLPAEGKPEKMLYIGASGDSLRFAHSQPNCFSVLATWGWSSVPRRRGGKCSSEQWRTVELFADAQIDRADEIESLLAAPEDWLPLLESLLERGHKTSDCSRRRYLVCNKFRPNVQGDWVEVYGLGRYYARHERHQTHKLTQSILENKESSVFPAEWVQAIVQAVKDLDSSRLVIAAIPARPERVDRMRAFLAQIESSGLLKSEKRRVVFAPDLLAYRDGVRSQHRACRSAKERFDNVREHLYVHNAAPLEDHPDVLIIDDVVTTGATFYYARQCLLEAGAYDVASLAMAMTTDNEPEVSCRSSIRTVQSVKLMISFDDLWG